MQHINLETFANGAFTAQVNRAIEEVTKNIQDPNTDAGTARKITVTIAFKPNQERNFIAISICQTRIQRSSSRIRSHSQMETVSREETTRNSMVRENIPIPEGSRA